MKYDTKQIGELVRRTRLSLAVTQAQLAFTAGIGLRFIRELENGKATCEIGKTLQVLSALGIDIALTPPVAAEESQTSRKRVVSRKKPGVAKNLNPPRTQISHVPHP